MLKCIIVGGGGGGGDGDCDCAGGDGVTEMK